jgi:hypothetical protein
LLYTIDACGETVSWASDDVRLRAIAQRCEECIKEAEFVLDRPIVVAPDQAWENITSWKTVRQLWKNC